LGLGGGEDQRQNDVLESNIATTDNTPSSPRSTAAGRLGPLRGASGSPRVASSGAIFVPISPSYPRTTSTAATTPPSTTSTSKGMKHFPTFRAEPSFRHHRGGMGAVIRDPIEVLERDEVGLIDQLVEEEWLPWSDDDEVEEEEEHVDGGEEKRSRNFENDNVIINSANISIPSAIDNAQSNGNANGTHQCASARGGDGRDDGSDSNASDDVISLRYSRSPDSASDDGLESNTGQHVMDGVMVAHSNSLRNNQQSGTRSSLELMESARNQAHRLSTDSDVVGYTSGHTTTTTTVDGISNPSNASSTSRNKFIGNIPTRPLGSYRSSTGMSHKSTDSIDEALRLHALSLNNNNNDNNDNTTPKPAPTAGGGGIFTYPIIPEEEIDDDTIDNASQQQMAPFFSSSSIQTSNWQEMPFTVRNAPLLRVIPKFYGVTHADDRTLLELEDLARWYRHPCIMDIKIGYQTWYKHADPDYIDRCKRKDAATTQASLGFKICGMQVYRHARGGYWRASKRWCKTLPEALVDKALASFANNEHGLRPSDVYGGDQGAVAQLQALESWFQVQKEFHLYSASLLLLYEGDAHGPEETNVRVRLVDFAHTFAVGGGGTNDDKNQKKESSIDENFLSGLRALKSRLNAVSTMEYVADTLMTSTAAV
jgi:Inositol polyphosphate kinase